MFDRGDLFPVRWIVAALVVVVVGTMATFAILTVTEPDPAPASEVVADVQGIPPSGGSPCWWVAYAQQANTNPALNQAYQNDTIDEASEGIDDAAKEAASELDGEILSVIKDFVGAEITQQVSPDVDIQSVLSEEIATKAPELGRVDVTSVLDC